MWQIRFTSKAQKQFKKLPQKVKDRAVLLLGEIKLEGSGRGNWPNYSKLGKGEFHCHLKKGKPTYVICWRVEDKQIKIVEVYYVGTHEKAPY